MFLSKLWKDFLGSGDAEGVPFPRADSRAREGSAAAGPDHNVVSRDQEMRISARRRLSITVSFVIFMIALTVGVRLAQLKPLWNDELYSQTYSLERLSYADIADGKVPEGNNAPLFYILQKAICDITGFHLNPGWKGEWNVADPTGQLILRFWPNIWMAVGLAAIFYFFSVEYSLRAGSYAVLTALSSTTVWWYWAEARPYSMWFSFTVLQLLILMRMLKYPQKCGSEAVGFFVVTMVLALTVVLSIIPSLVMLLLLLVAGKTLRPLAEQKYFLGMLGLLIVLAGKYYYQHSPHYNFNLPGVWQNLIFENFPWEWMGTIILLVGVGVFLKWTRDHGSIFTLCLLTGVGLGLALSLIRYLAYCYNPHVESFEMSSRYFVYLSALGVVTVSLVVAECSQGVRGYFWLRWNFMVVVIGVLLLRGARTCLTILTSGVY